MNTPSTSSSRDPADEPGMPLWVKVSGGVVVVLVVLFLAVHLAGGGMGGHAR
ncbi:hypothetical protein WJ438_18775 [Streptomyces sp. GD-15H]|uniref:hypothetical protein n=1 Tax=Streptomyces sp. GD-15H TaxID=3129112 RepID=UPI0032478A49